jgi:SAM-dependent methyltransferase
MTSDQSTREELERIRAEYARRAREIGGDRYAPWNPAEIFMEQGARRLAAVMLNRAGAFPRRGSPCLEIGYGKLGWLGILLNWGLRSGDLCGMELLPDRARLAQEALPGADLRVGDACALPWEDSRFPLIVVSTVFTSILDAGVRLRLAREINRCLAPGGALLWYDFAFNNPRNPQVRAIKRSAIRDLFPSLGGEIRRVTLAPPLARMAAPRSWTLATALEAVPWLRTHLMAVLIKQGES